MLEYTDFGWWQAREDGSAVVLANSTADGESHRFWPWMSANSTMKEILESLWSKLLSGSSRLEEQNSV